jgi:hypothetical protein
MTVESGGLTYDAKSGHWDFGRAIVTLPESAEEDSDVESGGSP